MCLWRIAHRFRRLGLDDELVLLEILGGVSAVPVCGRGLRLQAVSRAYLECDLHLGSLCVCVVEDGAVLAGCSWR